MRNLKHVIIQMIDALPETVDCLTVKEADTVDNLIREFRSLKKSIGYAAPEMSHTWWNQLASVVNAYMPQDYLNLNPWQKKVVDIFTGVS